MKRTRGYLWLIGLLVVAGALAPGGRAAQMRHPVEARSGMVASTSEIASRVGVEILRRGGNAVDAAVAVGLALAITYPAAGNLGGGGFMLIRTADDKATAVDFRETAPGHARREMYLDREGKVVPDASLRGYLAAGVPGTVAGLALALEKHGTLKWAEVVEPARRLAAEGFPVSAAMANSLRAATKVLNDFPESRRLFLRDGKPYEAGETFRQPELAATLQRLKDQGPREFYEGKTARLLADDMAAHGGLIDLEDLRGYRAVERAPLRGTYRGYEIITMPPPSSGGVALIELLNILEGFDLRSYGAQSSVGYHLMIEAMRRAFADRAEFLGDPDFVRVPVAGLTEKFYAAQLAQSLDRERAGRSAAIGHGHPPDHESPQTTHYSVVDAAGNAVAVTYTLNGLYGCGVTVAGAGFLLNNEMDDFTAKPGVPNGFGLIQAEANAIAPRKRPLSSMTPTIVCKDGRLVMALGSPGGPTIINTVLQVIVNVVDYGMNLQQAVSAPRIHHQWLPDEVRCEPFGMPRDVQEALQARGHVFAREPATIGDVQAVMVDPATGARLGASDPRSADGRAVGY